MPPFLFLSRDTYTQKQTHMMSKRKTQKQTTTNMVMVNLVLHFCFHFRWCLDILVARRTDDIPPLFISKHSFSDDSKHLLLRQPKTEKV